MRRFSLLLLFLTVLVLTVSAVERPVSKMRQAALQSLNANRAKCVLDRQTLAVYSDGNRFSIVSRDDRFPSVLAYGNGNFDVSNLPSNVQWWFERVQRSMEQAAKEGTTMRASKTYTPVAPMMETKWGQYSPYNDMAPRLSGDEQDQDSPRCPSGCVATAMAQIMNFQQYPEKVEFSGSCYLNGELFDERDIQSTYSWPYLKAYGYYLPDGYTSEEDVELQQYNVLQGKRVATLLRDCGYAIGMSYTESGSGASITAAGIALVNIFGYPDQSVKYYDNFYYTTEEWMNMMAAEMQNGCPILYAGYSESGGHAFVFHGMDADGLAYVNWGWDGLYDGYYAVGMLKPSEDDYSYGGETMVIGIRPTALSTDVVQSLFTTDEPYEFTYDADTHMLSITLKQAIYNLTSRDFKGRWCVVIEDVDNPGTIEYTDLLEEGTVIEWFMGYGAQSFPFAEIDLPSGNYRLYMATLDEGETDWQYVRTVGGAFYYEVTVDADGKLTIAKEPTFITVTEPTAIQSVRQQTSDTSVHYYNLQGHKLNGSAKGLVIRKQGSEVKKVIMK